jgi:hypothetical protein
MLQPRIPVNPARPHVWQGKGAVEDQDFSLDRSARPKPDALASQLGHRDPDDMIKDNDTDFPEPDAEAEHS